MQLIPVGVGPHRDSIWLPSPASLSPSLFLLLLFLLGPTTTTPQRHHHHPCVLMVSFDGFRTDYLDWWPTPNLARLRAEGATAHHLNNVFLTKTFGNHYSLATGVYQETHGVVGNTFYDPVLNQTLGVDNGTLFWDYNPGVHPIWLLNQRQGQNRFSGGMMWPGSAAKIQNELPHYVQAYNRSMPWKDRVDMALGWMTDPTHPANLVLLYIEEPDRSGHGFGPNSTQVRDAVYMVDNITGYMVGRMEELGIFHDVNLIFLSDHGMQELRQERIINVSSILDKVKHRVFGASPIMHILPDAEEDTEKLYAALSDFAKVKNFTAYRKEEMPYRWHYNNSRRVMPIVLVADEGYGFQDLYDQIDYYNKNFNLKPSPDRVYGIHGYDNALHSMNPFFIAHGPAFKKNHQIQPFSSLDIYPLICKILDLIPAANNGSLAEVEDMLVHNSSHMKAEWIIAGSVLLALLVLLTLAIVWVKALVRRKQAHSHTELGYRQLNRRNDECGDGNKNEEEEQHLLVSAATEDV